MKKAVRILAVHAGDPDEPQDKRWKIILDAILNEDLTLVRQDYFGFTQEVDDENDRVQDWPFILRYSKGQPMFDWGYATEYETERTNLYSKAIRVNETFSRGSGEDVGTYRITSVEPMT